MIIYYEHIYLIFLYDLQKYYYLKLLKNKL